MSATSVTVAMAVALSAEELKCGCTFFGYENPARDLVFRDASPELRVPKSGSVMVTPEPAPVLAHTCT